MTDPQNLRDFLSRVDSSRAQAIPVFREILADLDTPVSAFLKLGPLSPHFLLESVVGGTSVGRYSFIGSICLTLP